MSTASVAPADRITIDWCPQERVADLQAFIETQWRAGHVLARDAALLRWQHAARPDGHALSVLVAMDGEELIGTLGVIPVEFGVYGRRHPTAWLTMWVTAPAWRSRRIGMRLLQRVLTGDYDLVGTIGNNELAGQVFRGLRFQMIERIPRWVQVVSPERVARLLERGGVSSPSPVLWRRPAGATPTDTSSVRLIEWTEEIAPRWDRAWEERFAPDRLGVWRDAAYLRWRYVTHPRFYYELRAAEDRASGDLRGLIVYRVEPVRDLDERVLHVVECVGDDAAQDALAGCALDAARSSDVAFADFYCASPVFARPLAARGGFVPEEQLPCALPQRVQPLEWTDRPLEAALWRSPRLAAQHPAFDLEHDLYMTRSDCDQDRPN